MKNKFTLLMILGISVSVFAQKKELKKAEKLLKKKDYSAITEQLKLAEPLMEDADPKLKEKYYYLKAKSIYAGSGDETANNEELSLTENDTLAAFAFKELIAYEKESGQTKYLNEAETSLGDIIIKIAKSGSKEYKGQNYKKASYQFEMVYTLNEKDTSFLDNAGLAAYLSKDYDRSIKIYNQLLELGYTGVSKQYRAKSVATGEYMYFASQGDMDSQVLLETAKEPEVFFTESRTGDIAKNIALSYIAKGEDQAALDAIAEARKSFPNDYTLVISEANIYYELGDNEKFLSGLKEAISIRPNDPQLYYNVGVLTLEQGYVDEAIASFEKAIELKPDYVDAYNNIGVAILERTKPIVEEMNKNLSNFKKYDELSLKQKDVYKDALPYFEKTLEFGPANKGILSTLVGLYEILEMYDKQKETQAKLDTL